MENLKRTFTDFFRIKSASDPSLQKPSQIRASFETLRGQVFQLIEEKDISLKSGEAYSSLQGKVYQISCRGLSGILCRYDDTTLLWLDHHSNNVDYEEFIRRENLASWIPNEVEKLVSLLAETKFNFVNRPQVICSNLDIPQVSQHERKLYENDQYWRESIEREDKSIEDLASQIHPPRLNMDTDNNLSVTFFLWTQLGGRVLGITASFNRSGQFDYTYEELANGIGDSVIMRDVIL